MCIRDSLQKAVWVFRLMNSISSCGGSTRLPSLSSCWVLTLRSRISSQRQLASRSSVGCLSRPEDQPHSMCVQLVSLVRVATQRHSVRPQPPRLSRSASSSRRSWLTSDRRILSSDRRSSRSSGNGRTFRVSVPSLSVRPLDPEPTPSLGTGARSRQAHRSSFLSLIHI